MVFSSNINGFIGEVKKHFANFLAPLSEIHCFSYDTVYILLVSKNAPQNLIFDLYTIMEKCNMLTVIVQYDFINVSRLDYSLKFKHSFVICKFCTSERFLLPIHINSNFNVLNKLRKTLLKEASHKIDIYFYTEENNCLVNVNCNTTHEFAHLASKLHNFTLLVHPDPKWLRLLNGTIESYNEGKYNGSSKELNLYPGQHSVYQQRPIEYIVIYCEKNIRTNSSSPYYLFWPFTVTCWMFIFASIFTGTFVTTRFRRGIQSSDVLFNSVLRYLLRQDTYWPKYWHLHLALGYFVLNICYEAKITSLVIKPNPPIVYSTVLEMFADGYKVLLNYNSNKVQEAYVETNGFHYFKMMWSTFFPESVNGFQQRNVSSDEALALLEMPVDQIFVSNIQPCGYSFLKCASNIDYTFTFYSYRLFIEVELYRLSALSGKNKHCNEMQEVFTTAENE